MGFVGNQLCFPETNSSNLLYLLRIVLQNLLIAEVTCEVLELALEEGIQPNGRQPLVSSEKRTRVISTLKSYLMIFAP